MPPAHTVPGVSRRDVLIAPQPPLPTGIPGFVGFAEPKPGVTLRPYSPVALHRKDEFAARYAGVAGGYLADAVAGFFANGGARCYVAFADAQAADRAEALTKAVES